MSAQKKSSRPNHLWSAAKSTLHQSACGPVPRGAKRPLVLHLEQLEDRYLMNADPAPLEVVLQTPETVQTNSVVLSNDVVRDDVAILSLQPIDYNPYLFYPLPPEAENLDHIEELPDWLVTEADRLYGEQFGTQAPTNPYLAWNSGGIGLFDATVITNDVVARSTTASLSVADSFSSTNIQVAGVDEADLVETDGEFLYIISGSELLIVDVRDADQPSLASRVELDSQPTGIYLDGDRLTLSLIHI